MSNELTVTESNAANILQELEEAFFDIPFENSDFQIKSFVIESSITPERAYRAVGINMISKLQSLKSSLFSREILQMDIEECKEQIALLDECSAEEKSRTSFSRNRRKKEIELLQLYSSLRFQEKLINDLIKSLNVYYHYYKAFPKYTKEQFEQGEYRHFMLKFIRDVQGATGSQESLLNLKDDGPNFEKFINYVNSNPALTYEEINKFTDNFFLPKNEEIIKLIKG